MTAATLSVEERNSCEFELIKRDWIKSLKAIVTGRLKQDSIGEPRSFQKFVSTAFERNICCCADF